MTPRDLAALLALAAVWGGSFLFIRVSVASLGPLPLAAGRVAIAAVVLAIGMRLLGRDASLRGRMRRLLVLGGLNAAIPYALISAAELQLTASYAAMLNATVPLWSVAFGAVWLGERVTAKRVTGLAVGLLGVAVLVGWSPVAMTPIVLLCVAATLVATASYALAGVYAKRRLADVSAPALALGQQVGALPWLALPAAWQLPDMQPTPVAVAALLALAILSTAFAYLLYFRLLASVGPTRTSTVTYLLPVFGSAWGALFLGEAVTAGMFAGLALILGSVVLVNDVRVGALLPWRRRAAAEACG